MTHPVTLIAGDGVGPEVTAAARRCLDATGVELDWDIRRAGIQAYEANGDPLPQATLESIRERGVALKGPLATPTGAGYRSVNLAIRSELDLHAGVRPCRSLMGADEAGRQLDVVIVRMNTEDLYAGLEFAADSAEAERIRELVAASGQGQLGTDTGISLKPISTSAARRVAEVAFERAAADGRRSVTAVHKATVMRHTDGAFLKAAREVAAGHSGIELHDRLVDTVCHDLVRKPSDYEVLLTPILYGDVLSDLGAALIGGLGMAAGANLGPSHAVFEPVHGTAPRHAGAERANPCATILSGAMLLRHLGEGEDAERLESAVASVVSGPGPLTYDLHRGDGRPASTAELASAVIAALEG